MSLDALLCVGKPIKRENVYIYSTQISMAFVNNCSFITDLSDEMIPAWSCFCTISLVIGMLILLHKAHIIRPGHAYVNIIIPRNKTFMSHSTNQCTISKVIANLVRSAESVDILQYGQHKGFELPEIDFSVCSRF